MMEKKAQGSPLQAEQPPLHLLSVARWQRIGRILAARRWLAQRWLRAGAASALMAGAGRPGWRWRRLAEMIGARHGLVPASAEMPSISSGWHLGLRLDLPLLAPWDWAGYLPLVRASRGPAPVGRERGSGVGATWPSSSATDARPQPGRSLPPLSSRAADAEHGDGGQQRAPEWEAPLAATPVPPYRRTVSAYSHSAAISPPLQPEQATLAGASAGPQRPVAELAPAKASKTPPDAQPTLVQLRTVLARTPYTTPDVRLRSFLADIVRLPLPAVRIYVGPAADAIVRSYGADAITYGDAVLFRRAAYQPASPAGLALLGHELTHATLATQPAATLPPTVVQSGEEEERLAQENERLVLHTLEKGWASPAPAMPSLSGDGVGAAPPGTGRQPLAGSAAPSREAPAMPLLSVGSLPTERPPSGRPAAIRTAPVGRDLGGPASAGEQTPATVQLTDQQLRLIKDAVYRDLMNRLRMEHERGG